MRFQVPEPYSAMRGLADRVEQRLKDLGLNRPGRPASPTIPDLPADLTNVTTQEVGRLLGEYNAWLAYISPEVARARVNAKEAKANAQAAKTLKRPADPDRMRSPRGCPGGDGAFRVASP